MSPGSWKRIDAAIVLVCLGCLAAAIAACWAYVNDDAFISFRYAANLLAGEGMNFNPGERVEGYSNFSWVLTSALLLLLAGPENILPAAKLAGAAAAAGTVVVTYGAGRHLYDSRIAAAGAALLLATSVPFAANAVSGLETPLFALLIALALWLRVASGPRGDPAYVAVMVLASLTRPEGFYLFAVLLPVHLLAGFSWRRVVRIGAGYAVAVAPYLAWKWLYYGSLLPNTYFAKPGSLLDGLTYAREFVFGAGFLQLAGLPLLAVGVGLVTLRRARLWLLAFLAALASAVVISGGDWMLGWRFFMPSLAVIALAAGAAIDRLVTLLAGRRRGLAPAAAMLALIALAYSFGLPREAIVAECRRRGEGQASAHLFIARWLAERAQPGQSVALMDVGMVGFYSSYAGLRVIDITGLTDPVIARAPGKMLHKQYDPSYVLEQRPDYLVLVGSKPVRVAGRPSAGERVVQGRGWALDPSALWFQERRIAVAPDFAADYDYLFSRVARFEGYLHVFRRRGGPVPAAAAGQSSCCRSAKIAASMLLRAAPSFASRSRLMPQNSTGKGAS
jgi:hypothetical protein